MNSLLERSAMFFAAIHCAVNSVALGQTTGQVGGSIVERETVQSDARESGALTLDELKVAGALRSSYRNQQPHAVSAIAPEP